MKLPVNLTRSFTALVLVSFAAANSGFAEDVWQSPGSPAEIAEQQNAREEIVRQLRLRDQALDNRTLEIEKRWTETIVPLHDLMRQRRRHPGSGGKEIDLENVAQPYDQPHRLRYQITVRRPEQTLRIVKELEPRINSDFGRVPNEGFVWSFADGVLTDYSPVTRTAHRQTPYAGNLLGRYVRSFQWCCGFGYGSWIQEIKSIQVRDDKTTVLFGNMRLLEDDQTGCTLHLDRDWIVRKAIVSIPGRSGGSDEHIVFTTGTVRPKGALPLAASGHFRRILRPPGRKFSIDDDYRVIFVSISNPLADEQYDAATRLDIPSGTNIVDMRRVLGG